MGKIILGVLWSLLATFPAQADWDKDSQHWAATFNQARLITSGDLASVWGGVRARESQTAALKLVKKVPYEVQDIPSSHFKLNALNVGIHIATTQTAKDVIVILPGIFDNIEDAFPEQMVRFFAARDYHVIVIPNSWSNEYLDHGPLFSLADFHQEAAVVLETVASVVQNKIGTSHVGKIHLVGESYGSFLTSAVIGQDVKGIISGSALLISPPVHLLKAMQRLDQKMKENASRRAFCSETMRIARGLFSLATEASEKGLSPDVTGCAGSYLAFDGFQSSLVQATQRLAGSTFAKLTAEQKSNLAFGEVMQNFLPQILRDPHVAAVSDIGYWIRRAKRLNPKRDVRIVSSMDDLLNLPSDWDTDGYFKFDPGILLRLQWGGHLGFVEVDSFEKLLDHNYGSLPAK